MRVVLYKDPSSRVEWEKLMTFLSEEGFSVSLREDLFLSLIAAQASLPVDEKKMEDLAQKIARIRVMGLTDPPEVSLNPEPFQVEVDYEWRNLRREDRKVGPVYSGFHFQSLLREIWVRKKSLPVGFLHIIFSNQRLATWGEDRWHLRTILLGFPSIISTTGLVEAPAKEREYYLLKSVEPALGEQWLKENPNHLEVDDSRLTEVLKGYLWQAIFYGIQLGEVSFCKNPDCSLYNSHWQREVLKAQLGGRLCEEHIKVKHEKYQSLV